MKQYNRIECWTDFMVSKYDRILSLSRKYKNEFFRIRRVDDKGNNLTSILKRKWIDEASEEKKYFQVQGVFGELIDPNLIIYASEAAYCSSIQVIFGPKLADMSIRENLRNFLMNDESSKLSLYRSLDKPLYDCLKIKNNYIYDDAHEINKPPKWSTCVLNGDAVTQSSFDLNFSELVKKSRPITKYDLDEVEVYSHFVDGNNSPKMFDKEFYEGDMW
jgi:hypothetical protein